ncbi:MAG: BRCT domain-containing protein [Polyangiaceae bacterium]
MQEHYEKHQQLVSHFAKARLDVGVSRSLQGLAAGLIADGVVCDAEVAQLRAWITRYQAHLDAWPLSELHALLSEILADGVVDEEERHLLLVWLSAMADSPEKAGTPSALLIDPFVRVVFPSREFVFTGALSFCGRREAQDRVQGLGGLTPTGVRKTTHYLVLGDLGSDNWITSRYGTKIERARELQQTSGLEFVREVDFLRALLGAESRLTSDL